MEENRWRGPLVRTSDWAWRLLVVFALAAVVIWAGMWLATIVVPTLLAVVVVPVGRPLVERLQQRLPGSLAAALVLLLAILILVLAGWLMIASIAANWTALSDGLNDAVVVFTDWLSASVASLEDVQAAEIEENLGDLVGSVTSVLVGGATRGVVVIGSLVVGLLFFVVTLYFGLRDWDLLRGWVLRNTMAGTRPKAERFLDRYDIVLRSYWKGQALVGAFDAVALGAGLWLIGVPLVLPIAILTFVISFIPYVGAVIATVLAVFVTLGTEGSGAALLVLVLSLLIFNTGENLMRPWLVGETIEMPTFVVFLAGTIGVLVAGAFGAIVAIPLVALALEAKRVFMDDEPESTRVPESA